jgi:hypothetical protein
MPVRSARLRSNAIGPTWLLCVSPIAHFMKTWDAIHRFFGTEKWRRAEADRLARQSFSDYDYRSAAAVLDILVLELGVTFEQLRPGTRLAADLGADEDEPFMITLHLKETLNISVSAEQVVESQTVGGLVELASRSLHETSA